MEDIHKLEKEFYSIKEFAIILDVHPNTIRKCIKSGRISAVKVGNRFRPVYRIARSEINRMAVFDLNLIIERMAQIKIESGK